MFPAVVLRGNVAELVVNGVEFVEVADCTSTIGGVTVDCGAAKLRSCGLAAGPSNVAGTS